MILLQVDIFSLGIVIFEIWHPFGTVMERLAVLEKLRDQGILPSAWELEHTPRECRIRGQTRFKAHKTKITPPN